MVSRNIAYKLWISDINGSEYVKSMGEFESNYIKFQDKQVSRINLVATVINKYESENYASIIIDDGSSQISVKSWNENRKIIDKTEIGDTLLIIAKIRQNIGSNTLFLQPEILKKVDNNWKVIRANELELEYGKPEAKREKITEDKIDIKELKVSNVGLRIKILDMIENSKEGIAKEELSNFLKGSNINSEIEELIKTGQFNEDELRSTTPEDRIEIKKERLNLYKEQLADQKLGIAEINAELEWKIVSEKEINKDVLMGHVMERAKMYNLSSAQIEKYKLAIDRTVKKDAAAANILKNRETESDSEIFKKLFVFSFKNEMYYYGIESLNKKFLEIIKKEKPDYLLACPAYYELTIDTLIEMKKINPKMNYLLMKSRKCFHRKFLGILFRLP